MIGGSDHANMGTRLETGLGALLRQWRRERGLTLDAAARAAGIARRTLIRWEGGTHQPRRPELEAVLTALSADPSQRRRAFALLEAPRGQGILRTEVARLAGQM